MLEVGKVAEASHNTQGKDVVDACYTKHVHMSAYWTFETFWYTARACLATFAGKERHTYSRVKL